MSNGTPETFEGGPEGPPSLLAILALVYSIAWIVCAFVSLLFGLTFLTSRLWLLLASIALLAASIGVIAREMGVFRGPREHESG